MSDDLQHITYSVASGVASGKFGHKIIYCLHNGYFYIYQDNFWKETFPTELLSTITTHKELLYVNKKSITIRKQILEELKLLLYKPLSDFNCNGFVNFSTGLLDVSGNNFIAHNPDIITTVRMAYNYDVAAQCPLWLKTLSEIFEGNQAKINILQEFFGYCLTRDTRKEKALLLLGESRTGKSTILHVLRYMVGIQNCSSVPLKFINNPQYTPLLINKLVNLDSDVSSKATEYEAEFKIITSGEPVSVNQKFVPTFEFNPYCKLVMAANEFPRITDHSSAFYKRLILLSCDRVFEDDEINNKLKDELLVELPGILQWSLQGLLRLNKRGRFEGNKFMVDAIAELREESNPVEMFFSDTLEIDLDGQAEISKGELYDKYVVWCKANGNGPLAANRFSQAVYRKYSKVTPKKATNGNTKQRVWKNLRYINQQPQGEKIEWHN